MIDPNFWGDKEFFLKILKACKVICGFKTRVLLFRFVRDVRFFYIGLWNFADDEGRFIYDLVKLKGEIVPFDEDFTLKKIQRVMEVLEKAKRIFIYEVEGIRYGWIVNFKKHQTINRPTPSILPPPPEDKFSEWLTEDSLSDSGVTHAQVKLSKVKLSKVKKESPPSADPKEVDPSETPKQKQDRRITTIIAFIKKNWNEDLTPSQIQVLVYGLKREKRKVGFKTYEALWEFLKSNKNTKPKGPLYPYLRKCSIDEKTVSVYGDKAFREKDPQLIGEILEDLKDRAKQTRKLKDGRNNQTPA